MRPFVVQIPQYEGPLDLLLCIVRQNKLPIANLALAPVAAQYLAYVNQAETLDVNLSMEWVEMAARLIQWKSSSLLPSDPALPDPGEQLSRDLKESIIALAGEQLTQATAFLAEQAGAADQVLTLPVEPRTLAVPSDEEAPTASLWTIRKKARTVSAIFQRRRTIADSALIIAPDGSSVEEMRIEATRRLELTTPGIWFSASPWFSGEVSSERNICLFLALLDMARDREVNIADDPTGGGIRLRRTFSKDAPIGP